MYHPTRGGVRGGRDQFKWDDVKVDKHRENYLGHSVKAPVGRWQKGKDLNWYARDKKSNDLDMEAAKAEIQRIKEDEEQAMREALGLAPKRTSRSQGNRLDKHELSELVKRGSTTGEDLGEGHPEAAKVEGLGFTRAPQSWEAETVSLPATFKEVPLPEVADQKPTPRGSPERGAPDDERKNKRRREERKHEKREKHRSRDSDGKSKNKRERERKRHDSGSD